MNDALKIGAQQGRFGSRGFSGWHSMADAPRDGTWIEIKNTYGVAPSYSIARWTDELTATDFRTGQKSKIKNSTFSWECPGGGGFISESHLHWRPYNGNANTYIDPTGGMQNNMAYWRGAIASKYGLPLDHFEAHAADNEKRNKKSTISWWEKIFARFYK